MRWSKIVYQAETIGSITQFRDDFYIFPLADFMNLTLVCFYE